jgi:hypothetical protein
MPRRHQEPMQECGGTDICQHQRRRSTCKECGGASICPHQRQRSQCKECGRAARTSAEGAHARSAGGRTSASTSASGAHARSAGGASICQHQRERSRCKECRVRTTGGEAGNQEAGALTLAQKRQETVLTVSASLVPGDADGAATSGTHRALATAACVRQSQLCTAAAAAPLAEAAEGRVACASTAAGLRHGARFGRDGAHHR